MPVQTTDLTPMTGHALAYTADGEDWTIATGVLLASNTTSAVYSNFEDPELANFGQIFGDEEGVEFTKGGLVTNGSTGLIYGRTMGIAISGGSDPENPSIVFNAGKVEAGVYAIVVTSQSEVLIDNSGSASGLLAGVFAATLDGSIRVVNSGMAFGNFVGIGAVLQGGTGTVTIVNTGTIKVGSLINDLDTGALLAGGGEAVELENSGTIIGRVVLSGSANGARVQNSGLIDGETLLGDENDTFDGAKGTQGPVHGGDGDDTLIGGSAGDSLFGDLGNDMLTGGGGADEFWFTSQPDSKTNRDTITDFSHSEGDKIVLDRDIFTGLGKNATTLKGKYFEIANKPHSKNDKIVYNEKKGILIYAENGSKTDKADMVKFANVHKGTELDHGDFLIA